MAMDQYQVIYTMAISGDEHQRKSLSNDVKKKGYQVPIPRFFTERIRIELFRDPNGAPPRKWREKHVHFPGEIRMRVTSACSCFSFFFFFLSTFFFIRMLRMHIIYTYIHNYIIYIYYNKIEYNRFINTNITINIWYKSQKYHILYDNYDNIDIMIQYIYTIYIYI